MKKLLILPAILVFLYPAAAQLSQGKIIFERIMDMHRRMTDESMKAMVPQWDSAKMQLLFSGTESLFKSVHEEEDIRNTAGDDGNRVIIRFGGVDNEMYKNYANDKTVELRELGPRKYIIEDTLRKISWKLTGESKTILGHACKKAVSQSRDGNPVVAWFAEDMTCTSGPDQFGGLPGMILDVDINNGELRFAAREIVTDGFDKKWVQVPSGAKKITNAEFQKLRDDEFGANPGGGPVIRIFKE